MTRPTLPGSKSARDCRGVGHPGLAAMGALDWWENAKAELGEWALLEDD